MMAILDFYVKKEKSKIALSRLKLAAQQYILLWPVIRALYQWLS